MGDRIRFAVDHMHQPRAEGLLLQPGHPLAQLVQMRGHLWVDRVSVRAPDPLGRHQILHRHAKGRPILGTDQHAALQFVAHIRRMGHLQAILFRGVPPVVHSRPVGNRQHILAPVRRRRFPRRRQERNRQLLGCHPSIRQKSPHRLGVRKGLHPVRQGFGPSCQWSGAVHMTLHQLPVASVQTLVPKICRIPPIRTSSSQLGFSRKDAGNCVDTHALEGEGATFMRLPRYRPPSIPPTDLKR